MDRVAEKVVQICQTLFCQQLTAEPGKPKSGMKEEVEDRVVRLLYKDAKMREAVSARKLIE